MKGKNHGVEPALFEKMLDDPDILSPQGELYFAKEDEFGQPFSQDDKKTERNV